MTQISDMSAWKTAHPKDYINQINDENFFKFIYGITNKKSCI